MDNAEDTSGFGGNSDYLAISVMDTGKSTGDPHICHLGQNESICRTFHFMALP